LRGEIGNRTIHNQEETQAKYLIGNIKSNEIQILKT